MKRLTEARLRLWPWAGFLLGGLGLILNHQIGSASNTDDCVANGAGLILPLGLLSLMLAGTGAFLSWRVWRRGEQHESEPRRLIALVSTGAAGLFAFAILLPMIAALSIPRCFG